MDRRSILEWSHRLGLGQPDPSSSAKWINYRCPFAPWKHSKGKDSRASFGIRVSEQRSHYWCFTCHSKGDLPDLAYQLGLLRKVDLVGVGKELERIELLGPQLYIPKWDDPISTVMEQTGHAAEEIVFPNPEAQYQYPLAAGHPYLTSRGIGVFAAAGLALRFDARRNRILFPVCTCTGRFAGFSGRATEPPSEWVDGQPLDQYGRPYIKVRDYLGLRKRGYILGEHRFRKGYDARTPIVIVEGLFDYAFLSALGIRRVGALLGTALTPEKLDTLLRFELPVLIWMDNDGPGKEATAKIVDALFGKLPLKQVEYPSGFDGADPASLPPSVVHKMYKNAEIVLDKNRIPC